MKIKIEIAYAGDTTIFLEAILIEQSSTVFEAIKVSKILDIAQIPYKEKLQLKNRVGIFGKIVSLDTILKEGDRVEIYRDLIRDPKESRRERAAIAKKRQQSSSKKR